VRAYLQKANQAHRPADSERDYLVDYPGFQQAYGLPIEIPEPGAPGWTFCAEPSGPGGRSGAVSAAHRITGAIEAQVRVLKSFSGVATFTPRHANSFRSILKPSPT
jgi:hypothetical protein